MRKAEILQEKSLETGYLAKVRDDRGEIHWLGGIQCPGSPPVGTKGVIEYTLGPSFGLWIFTPNKEES